MKNFLIIYCHLFENVYAQTLLAIQAKKIKSNLAKL